MDCNLVFLQLPGEILHLREPLFQQSDGFRFLLSGVQRGNAVQRRFNGPRLFGEADCLLKKPGGDMLPARPAGTLTPLQVGVFLHHIGVKIVLPLRQIGPVAYDFFGAQAVVFRQRHKGQMQVGRFLVHVYHRRNDILPAYPVNEEVCRPLEVGRYLFRGLALEKLRAGGYEGIHKPGAVFACPASGLFNSFLNEVVVAALWLDNVEIVLAPAGVNVRVAGVLLFFPFMVGFQRPCRVALVLLKSQNCVLCQILSDLLLRTVRGLF